MRNATIVKTWNWLTISVDGVSPLPRDVVSKLQTALSYQHITFNYGPKARRVDPVAGTVYKQPVSTTRRMLYYIDNNGLLNAPLGFLALVWNLLKVNGFHIHFTEMTTDMRPDVFVPDWDNVYRKMKLRNRQDVALQCFVDEFGGVFNAAPGFGKSFLIGAVALLFPRAKIAVVTKQRANVQGLVKDISTVVPCGQVGMNKKLYHRVTVYSADSLHLYDGQADLMIGDEAHQLAADKFASNIMQLFNKCRRFGCTATPKGRADNADLQLKAVFGEEIFHMSWQEAESLGLIVPIKVQWHSVVMDENPADGVTNGIIRAQRAIWRNTTRNQVIANVANRYGNDQVLILVETVDHAVHLWQHLPDFTLVYNTMSPKYSNEYRRSGLLPVGYENPSAMQLARYRDDFVSGALRKVIATDCWSTGVSFESLAVLIRADGRANKIKDTQTPGRVSRIDGSKQFGLLHDFLDQFDSTYASRAKRRKRNYGDNGWQQQMPPGLFGDRGG